MITHWGSAGVCPCCECLAVLENASADLETRQMGSLIMSRAQDPELSKSPNHPLAH
jgi:hypothetical protein